MNIRLRQKPILLHFLIWRRRAFYGVAKILTYVLLMLLIFLMMLQYPVVQTYAAQKLARFLSKKAGYPIYIEKVQLDWFDKLKLIGVYIKEEDEVHNIIGIEEIIIDYRLTKLYHQGKLYFDDIRIEGADVNLAIYQDSVLNITKFIDAIRGSSHLQDSTKMGDILQISDIYIRRSHFSYHDYRIPPEMSENVFDAAHFSFRDIQADIDYLIIGDTIRVKTKYLSLREEYSGIYVRNLITYFQYWEKGMSFAPFYAQINKSILQDTLIMFSYEENPYEDFINRMRIEASFRKSVIALEDIGYFAPFFKQYPQKVRLEGKFRGTISKFFVQDFDLQTGERTHIKGNISVDGLPEVEATFINLRLKHSRIYAPDVVSFLTPYQASIFQKFETINFKANFTGFFNDFVADGQFQTKLGYLDTDINIKTAYEYYKGDLITKNFHIGKLWDMPEVVQQITMRGQIEGKGFTIGSAYFETNAFVEQLGIKGYNYHNIYVNGRLSKRLFNGELSVKDENLNLHLDGIVSFKDSTFRFKARIDTANLYTLKLFPDTLLVHSEVIADFRGLTFEDIEGKIVFRDVFLQRMQQSLDIDSFYISTHKNTQQRGFHRDIQIYSELLHIIVEGDYQISQLVADVSTLLEEYKLSIAKDTVRTHRYYVEKTQKQQNILPYKLEFNAKFIEINPILKLVAPRLYVAPYTKLHGNLEIGIENLLEFSFFSDSLKYENYSFYHDTLILYTSKKAYLSHFDFEMLINSKNQNFNTFRTQHLFMSVYRFEDVFYFNNYLENAENTDKITLKGTLELFEDRYEVNLTNTELMIMNDEWDNAGINKLIYYKNTDKIEVEDLHFVNGNQMFRFDGFVSADSADKLNFLMHNIDISFLENYIDKPIRGIVDIDASFLHLYQNPDVELKARVDSLFIGRFYVGTVKVKSAWNENHNWFDITASVERNHKVELNLFGNFNPLADSIQQLDITLLLEGISVQIIETFVEEHVSQIDGLAIGYLKIKGKPFEPRIRGDILVQEGSFKINYLGTSYKFEDKIFVREDGIEFRKFRLIDKNNHVAILNGKITHRNFRNIGLNLSLDLKEFCVLDKPLRKNEDLYYGIAISSGNILVQGPLENLLLGVNATLIEGTKLYLPLDTYASVEKSEFVEFINPLRKQEDTLSKKIDLSGIRLDFNLDVQPETYCEIILDQQTGDIIKGNVEGKLKMVIDTKGEFSIMGNIEIVRGNYTFTLLNAMNKKFSVRKGSRISWNGDPFKAQIDVTADYQQRVSFAPLMTNLDSSILNRPEIRRRYPAIVIIKMKGDVLSPEINFDIDFSDYPSVVMAGSTPVSLESYVQAFRQRIRSDESEMNKQVFSLIVLKRLLSNDSGFSGSAAAGSSLSELLSNQISYWVSQVDENLEINIDVGDQGMQSINLRLSYNFLEGRLRVTRDGDFGNAASSSDFNRRGQTNPIGNWSLEYMITPNGELRARMYSRQNLNAFNANLGTPYTSGVSLQHAKSFNNLRELFGIESKKSRQKIGIVPSEKEIDEEENHW
ncbi:MAG: translocation/assembly module TamB [Cytophagales bacterium]|nr:translocation/assembly module TamB [Cytophagales bacterium]MDW8384504.1 translocation/assembly module TamB domain-containing protein [Flammeovirgaceae bacterium]